jgi:hypothetical protein
MPERRNATLTIKRKSATLATETTVLSATPCYITSPTGPRGEAILASAGPLVPGANAEPTHVVLFDVARTRSGKLSLQTNDEFIITGSTDQSDGTYYMKGDATRQTPANSALPVKYLCYVKVKTE